MKLLRPFRSRAAGLWRALWPVIVVVAGAVTCDSPTSLRHRVSLAVTPVLGRLSMSGFGGMVVDSVRLTVTRPPSTVLTTQTLAFSTDSAAIQAKLTVDLSSSHELLVVQIEYLAGSQVLFTGIDTVDVNAGITVAPATVPLSYVGPGNAIAAIHITPRDTGVVVGAAVQYTVTATDASSQPVTQFYISLTAAPAAGAFTGTGMLHTGPAPGTAWVYAHTPNGIWDSTTVILRSLTAAGPPATMIKSAGDGQSANVGAAVGVAPRVRVLDANAAGVPNVQVQFAATSGGGSVTGGTATTDVNGFAQPSSWTLGATPGANTLTATLPVFPAVTPVIFGATGTTIQPTITIVLPGAAISLGGTIALPIKLSTPAPSGGVTVTVTSDSTQYVTVANPGTIAFAQGDTLKTINITGVAIGVSFLHATGTGYLAATAPVVVTPNIIALGQNVVVAVGSTANVSITMIPAPSSAVTVTLASTDTTKVKLTTPTVNFAANQANGQATVQGIAAGVAGITAAAPNYATGGTVVTAGVAGQPVLLTKVTGDNQTAQVGTAVTVQPSVKVTDIVGAVVANATVTFSVVTGGGSVTGGAALSNASGIATVGSWTLGGTAGSNTLMASTGSVTPVLFTATGGAAAIASTLVSPHAQTINAFGGTFQLVAQAKDALGNNVAGHFTWVSRTPAAVTVDTTGKVTAVTNGTSYVVATEAGSSKDSALVTVLQTVASINVTPGTRNIYLTRNFSFTAQAVDGLGHPVPGVTTFNWSTTAPAVATVDTSVHAATTLVTAGGLGSAQIRATNGAIIGVANVTVLTPITRIAVVVDTVGAAKTDTFTLTSLGLPRRYRGIAHDTVDAVMSGITFSWVSTNGAVAFLHSFTGDTATVFSAANGVTQVTATAQGFTSNPGASLTVAQVLASILLAPDASNPSAIVAATGTVHVSARGKDANAHFISGGSFKYASASPAFATVDSLTGVVTGVANGTSNITATSGAITSNTVTVTVGGAVPSIISFGRDTVSVGRGGNTQIPILLSKPDTAPLTVNLTATAFAHWNPTSVVVPTGQTSVNATLFGDSAGSTAVTATDGSGHGYSTGSAIARVTANMHLTNGGYAINATDIVTTQVVLSDPSPAGGTFVTFNYSVPGIAQVSPDPAFIPQGQLAADIQIRGLAAGSTNITPNAIGVNGTASSFTAYAPVLTPSTSFILLGQGQYEPNYYVQTQTYTNVPVPVTITSSDTNLVTVTPSVTIPGGSYYAYWTVATKGIGTATLAFSAPGWTQAHGVTVRSTTPAVGICCSNNSLFTTSPQQSVTVYSEDSLRTAHYRTNSLLVHLRSTDTSVIKLLDTVVTIPPALYYNNSGRFVMGAAGGTAFIVATASGHTPDSAQYTVSGPPLQLSWGGTPLLGAGQYDVNRYVQVPNNVTAPLVVTLTSSDSTMASVPATVTIPTNSYYAYFNVTGVAPGSVTIHASAAAYQAANASYKVTSPRVYVCCTQSMNNFGPGANVTVYSTDTTGSVHYRSTPLSVSMVSTDPSVVTVDSSSVTILAGLYYNNLAHVSTVSPGTSKLIIAATGHPAIDTVTYTVLMPTLGFSIGTNASFPLLLGRRQHTSNGAYVSTPDYRPSPLPVTIVQKHNTVDTLSSTALTIPLNSYYAYFDAFGLATGTDTLIVSAAGYNPATMYIRVTTPQLYACCMPGSATTTNPPFTMTVYTTDSVNNPHYAMDTIVVSAAPSDSTVIQSTLRSFRILKDTYYTQPQVFITGPGSSSMTYSDSLNTGYLPVTTGTITVTGPVLGISNSTTMLGMRQTGGANSAYVYAPNNVTSPLVVNLVSTDPSVVTVPASVTIPTGTYYAYFPITSKDVTGTIQVQATATGYGGAAASVQVTQPKFTIGTSTSLNTTSSPQTITVYATDVNGTQHYTTEDVVVTLVSSASSVAAIDSNTVTIVNGAYYSNAARWSPGLVGTSLFTASDARAQSYRYNSGTVNVQVNTPSLNLYLPGALGIGQYQDYASAQASDYQPADLTVSLTHTGTARIGTFTNLTNTPVTQLTIAKGIYYQYFRVAGLVAGTDTLVASATSPAHNAGTAYTLVGPGRVDPISNWPGTIKAGDSLLVTMYARDPNQGVHYVVAATQFNFTAVSNVEFWSGGAASANITSTGVTIPADAQYVQFYLKGKTAGTGSVTITGTNYTSYLNTVTVTP